MGRDHYSRAIAAALEVSNYYRFVERPNTMAEAEGLVASGDVAFVVVIPSDFGTRVERGDKPEILVVADATDPAAASGALASLATVAQRALLRAQGREAEAAEAQADALTITVHRRYNPAGVSQYNVVPGLLGVILQMTMVMMTSIALTREIERGTMENLLAMPANGLEIMLGKVLPYFVVGAVQVVVILGAARLLFHVPFVGVADVAARPPFSSSSWRWCCSATPSRRSRARRCRRCSSPSSSFCRRSCSPASCSRSTACRLGRRTSERSCR